MRNRKEFVDLDELTRATGLSRSTLLRMEHAGSIPRRVRLSPRRAAWRIGDVESWMAKRPPVRETTAA